jgi:oxygen-dependent protoporphyrinogen oxidase
MTRTCVIGAGLTGLIHAWRAHQNGEKVRILEAASFPGGVLQSRRIDGFLIDYGANTLSVRNQEVIKILKSFGLLDRAMDANLSANNRFIVRQGKLVTLPHSLPSFFTSPFLSLMGKLRLLGEPFIPSGKKRDESVADFIVRRLGKEALDYAGNPFLSGVYAAKPESLSIRHAFPGLLELEQTHGSLFKGMLKSRKKAGRLPNARLLSFPDGMQELPKQIVSLLPKDCLKLDTKVVQVQRCEKHWHIITDNRSQDREEDTYDQLICTLPSHQVNEIKWFGLRQTQLIRQLSDAAHYPLALVYHGYNKEQVSHPLNGFGFLVPEMENRQTLGTLFSSTIFPGRAPQNHALLTTFVGGERQPDLVKLEDNELHALVQKEHRDLLGTMDEPSFQKIVRWSKAIPLPDHNMGKRKEAAKVLHNENPGLRFSGSYLCGPPLPSCLQADIV